MKLLAKPLASMGPLIEGTEGLENSLKPSKDLNLKKYNSLKPSLALYEAYLK